MSPLRERVEAWCETTAEDIPLYLWPSEIFELLDEFAELKPEQSRAEFKNEMLEALSGTLLEPLKIRKHVVRIRYGKNQEEAAAPAINENPRPRGILGI